MSELDYSDYVTIKVIRVKDETSPSHWESDVTDKDGKELGGGTAPDFYGAVDLAVEMARKRNDIDDPEWSRFDANNRSNNA